MGESAVEAACAIVSAMNCSATSCGLLLALLTLFGASAASGESVAELDDAAARMQYAFYTGDSQGIETILKNLEQFQVEDSLAASKSYQLAYGNWKLSQLYLQPQADQRPRPNAKSLASKAALTCVRHARHAVEQDASMAEALAIEAACDGHSATARAASAGCANSKPLRTASGLAPGNPRIRFVQAICASTAAADPGAVERWRAVVASFEAAPPSRPGKPDWGHVEALTMLGETYLQRGDSVAARDALERALVMAPDYRQAQQLLQAAATRPR
jgi:tetratricopeptide (TPR) repeat protein